METHEIEVLCCDLLIEALARCSPFLNTTYFSISVSLIGGEIGAKSSGKSRRFTGWSRGRHMLKRKENPPESLIMPTSPIRTPVLR